MSLSTTPATARTDVAAPRTTPVAAPVSTRFARRVGIAVAGGSAAWAAGMLAFTNTPPAGTVMPQEFTPRRHGCLPTTHMEKN